MPGTTTKYGLRYPLPAEAPDGPGSIANLANDIDAALAHGSWTPTLTGTGTALGGNGYGDGTYFKIGTDWFLTGRFVFGSSASFGTNVASIINLPGTFNESTMSGAGYLRNGTNDQPFMFASNGTGAYVIKRVRDGNLAQASDYGTITQSSELRFHLRGVTA